MIEKKDVQRPAEQGSGWFLYAAGSAVFASLTSILGKIGISGVESNLGTAVRTGVVLVMSWLMVFVTGVQGQLQSLDPRTLLFLVLSGLATGASWLCYFRALQLGDVNKVVPVDKSSVVLTVLLSIAFLGEPAGAPLVAGLVILAVGTLLMIEPKQSATGATSWAWLPYAVGSAVFAALTSILGKVGIEGVDSNLGTALRTIVVLAMAWLMVAVQKKGSGLRSIQRGELLFICLSGVATGASWLCFFRALQEGPASLVVPIDKLSILVSIAFAALFLGERLTRRAAVGLALVVGGTLLMLV